MKKYIAAIMALSVGLGATCIALLILLIGYMDKSQVYGVHLENLYKKSLYVLSDNIEEIELDLSKVIATTTTATQRQLLGRIYDNCVDTSDNLSNLPISSSNQEKFNTTINTIGGYILSLSNGLDENNGLSEDDLNKIEDIHSVALNLYFDITYFMSTLDYEYEIVNSVDFSVEDSFKIDADTLSSEESGLPTLIYDGPFSSSVTNKQINGLSGEDISVDEGIIILNNSLGVYDIKSVKYTGQTTNKFNVYNYTVETKSGNMYAQVTVKGGLILNITSSLNFAGTTVTKSECETLAENLAVIFGLSDMKTVWSADSGNVVYVNLAPIIDNVIYYPDLIKVKVSKESGFILGWEAQNYAYNHTSRDNVSPTISLSTAKSKVSTMLVVEESNLCIIPNEYVGETLTYEFRCKWDKYIYYIYIDATTGEEANILRVVDTIDGSLVA